MLSTMPEVTKTLAKYLPSDRNPNCAATVIPPQLFLATVKLLAKLSSSFNPSLSTQTTTKSTQLREWASDTVARPAVIQRLVYILNTSESEPDPLRNDLRGSCAYAITALATLGPLFVAFHQRSNADVLLLESARSAILKINPLPVLVQMLSHGEAGTAATALTALKVTSEGADQMGFLKIPPYLVSFRSPKQPAVQQCPARARQIASWTRWHSCRECSCVTCKQRFQR